MITDLRRQKRTIKIDLEITNPLFNLDGLIDNLVSDLKIICEQRNSPEELKIKIFLE